MSKEEDMQRTMERATLALTLAAVLIVAACSTLGLPTPTTFNQKLAVAYSADTAVLQDTDTLKVAGKITAKDAQNIESQADNIKAALDIAREVYATDQATGNNKLAATVTALTALQNYITAQKGGS